ncbi:MAG: serine/threonine-protein kinase [Polyangiales bacterium]
MLPADVLRCASCGRLAAAGYRACPWCAAPLPTGAFTATLGPGSQIDFGWAMAALDQLLGEGGMGVVWHAWLHPRGAGGVQPPLEAAVKVLHATFSQQGRMRDLFANEARVLSSLAHPNVVRFYGITDVVGASSQTGILAIAMEYVRGETLGSLIERKLKEAEAKKHTVPAGVRILPCLPFDRAWHYFQQLLGALAATHALGIVHRDVKPDNVLLRTDGVAKLTDFGIARVTANVAASTGNMIAGTVAYMSPEQIQGKPLDGRSDLYAAGCVLYEMLTGRLPFPTEERSDWLVACDHVQTPPPPLRKWLPQAPIELEMLIAKALAKEPAERFQNAVEFGDAFRTTLGMPTDQGWRAQQALADQAVRYANALAVGTQQESPELQHARDAVARAYAR